MRRLAVWHWPEILLATCLLARPSHAQTLMKWPDLLGRPLPHADARIAYGPGPMQVVDLFIPPTPGTHPVVLMVHGGCWQTGIATLTIMNYIADDLRRRGIAVWNIEYRGVDRDGGGYPGTFQDVAAAADLLRSAAAKYRLRLEPLVALGHSAGGHLALWLAGRHHIPRGSPLFAADPLHVDAVVSLGGLPDLQADAAPPGDTCGADTVPRLVGRASSARPDVYADTSVGALLPLGVPQTLIHGSADRISPPATGAAYAGRAQAAGDRASEIVVPGQGHVEEITPGTPAWEVAVRAIKGRLGG